MRVEELLREDFEVSGDRNSEITSIHYNSKEVKRRGLFVAIKGTLNGHDFIEEAVKNGASAIVYEKGYFKPYHSNITWIGVRDSRDALAWMCSRFFGNPSYKLKMIGITGTNGKTTTSYLIREILKRNGKKTGIIGTIKYLIEEEERTAIYTTPEALELQELLHEMYEKGIQYVISEVSSHALALKRVDYTGFDIAVFTNLSREHLDFHKDMEEYFQVKTRLFIDLMKEGARAVINIDDVYGKRLSEEVNVDKILYSLENPDADVYVKSYSIGFKETELIIIIQKNKELYIKTSLTGIPNIYNILAAVSVAVCLNISLDIISSAISKATAPPGRFEKIEEGQDFLVFVDYAHTPDALQKLLLSVIEIKEKTSTNGRIITVFGCGGNRDRGKRPEMGRISTELSDHVILTSDNPRWEDPREIIREIEKGVSKDNYTVITDRADALWIGTKICKKGDILIVAGKGHEDYQEIKGRRYPFSDKEILKKLLKNLRG